MFSRALALCESVLGPTHPLTGQVLSNLAVSLFLGGRESEAEPVYLRAIAVREKALGPTHPDVGVSLSALSAFLQGTSRPDEALPLQLRAVDIVETNLQNSLSIGSETQKLSYLETFADTVDITFTLRSRLPDSAEAGAGVATLLLRQKGRVLGVLMQMADSIRASTDPVLRARAAELGGRSGRNCRAPSC